MAKRFDQHIHTSFSSDADTAAAMARVAGAAAGKGLAGIAVTDHYDPLWPDAYNPSWLDVPAYEGALAETEAAFAGQIRFAKGVELGLLPGEALAMCAETVKAFPYDFVIGSVHYSAEIPIDYPGFTEGRALRDIVDEYYTILLESVRAYKDYDVIGHINCIDRYTDGFAPDGMYMPYIDEVLRVAIGDGKGIEINTSSHRYGIGDRGTPNMRILSRFRELGGEIVTIGSDAHRPADIGAFIEKGEEMLLAAGFRYFAVYSQRQPEFFALSQG